MAFRIEALCLAFLIVSAQPATVTARKHAVTADDTGVTLDQQHWSYSDIQRLTLSADRLTLLTYQDRKWQPGRERRFTFDHLPEGAALQLYPVLRAHMDQRLIAELAEPGLQPVWKSPAKMERGLHGSNGTLIVGTDRIVFDTADREGARTWRYADISNISHAGLFDLSLAMQLGTEVRFTLKQPLDESAYHALWLQLEAGNGLKPYESRLGHH